MKKRDTMAFIILILLCFILAILNICIGSVRIPLKEIWGSFFGAEKDEIYRNILYQLRLPRLLAAMILGGGLSLSGYLLQTYFHNPIAGPFILGISSGAKLVVAAAMLLFLGSASAMSSWTMILAAFIGAMISMSFVLLMARLVKRMSILLISGVMIGYICSAITDLIVTFADDADIVNLHNWSKGSFSGITWDNVLVMTIVVAASFLGVFLISKPMSAYQLGEDYAASVGVNVKAFRALIVILSSLLAACVTAFAGPVSFVGIAVPHLVKQLLRSSRPILMIPACFLGGGAFCMFCDLLARSLLAPTELSISTVTAIFGAPVVIVILLRRKSGAH
jgi:iron complex transport system permease protein